MRKESAITSLIIHALAVLLMLTAVVRVTSPVRLAESVLLSHRELMPYAPRPSGGGARAMTPASAGHLPPRAVQQFTPLVIPVNFTPKLPVVATLDLPEDMKLIDSNLPNVGDPTGLGKLLSGGMGGPGGIGEGQGNRIGPDSGTGAGPAGVFVAGRGGVTNPVAIRKVEPEYSDEARKARMTGSVIVAIEIGPDGKPRNARVAQSLGLGLDEKATEAVMQWLFKPGTKDGKPVTVSAQVVVAFHLL